MHSIRRERALPAVTCALSARAASFLRSILRARVLCSLLLLRARAPAVRRGLPPPPACFLARAVPVPPRGVLDPIGRGLCQPSLALSPCELLPSPMRSRGASSAQAGFLRAAIANPGPGCWALTPLCEPPRAPCRLARCASRALARLVAIGAAAAALSRLRAVLPRALLLPSRVGGFGTGGCQGRSAHQVCKCIRLWRTVMW